jgi:hypothetical protein
MLSKERVWLIENGHASFKEKPCFYHLGKSSRVQDHID